MFKITETGHPKLTEIGYPNLSAKYSRVDVYPDDSILESCKESEFKEMDPADHILTIAGDSEVNQFFYKYSTNRSPYYFVQLGDSQMYLLVEPLDADSPSQEADFFTSAEELFSIIERGLSLDLFGGDYKDFYSSFMESFYANGLQSPWSDAKITQKDWKEYQASHTGTSVLQKLLDAGVSKDSMYYDSFALYVEVNEVTQKVVENFYIDLNAPRTNLGVYRQRFIDQDTNRPAYYLPSMYIPSIGKGIRSEILSDWQARTFGSSEPATGHAIRHKR